jgi:large subunit ribosomal protein L30
MSKNTIKVTLVRSLIGQQKKMAESIKGLGLRKVGSSSVLNNTPETIGLINKVKHLIKYEL